MQLFHQNMETNVGILETITGMCKFHIHFLKALPYTAKTMVFKVWTSHSSLAVTLNTSVFAVYENYDMQEQGHFQTYASVAIAISLCYN